jgi:hypothetical protein
MPPSGNASSPYDPTIVDAQKARQSRADAEFLRDRLQAALPAPQLRLQELQAQEYSVQWHDEYAQILRPSVMRWRRNCEKFIGQRRAIWLMF